MKIILDESYARVSYVEEFSEMQIIWKNVTIRFDDYKNAFNVALAAQPENNAVNYMSDIRDQKVLPPNFRKWFQGNAVPRAKESGIVRGAVIFDGNIFKKYYLNHIMNTTKKFGIELKFFGEVEQAEKWFKSQM